MAAKITQLLSKAVIDVLGLDSLFAELVTGIGLALLVGNLYALWKHRRGDRPKGVVGDFRSGRVAFLLVVGVLMTVWGLASIIRGGDGADAAINALW